MHANVIASRLVTSSTCVDSRRVRGNSLESAKVENHPRVFAASRNSFLVPDFYDFPSTRTEKPSHNWRIDCEMARMNDELARASLFNDPRSSVARFFGFTLIIRQSFDNWEQYFQRATSKSGQSFRYELLRSMHESLLVSIDVLVTFVE